MKQLNNKIVIITGGTSGIGRAAALLFAKEGAKVVVAGRREDKGEETVKLIEEQGGEASFVRTDILKKDQVIQLVEKTVALYHRIDCAFNCGGIDGKKARLIELEEADWDEIIDTNLKGTFLLMKYEIQQMLKQQAGVIVNMASVCSTIVRAGRAAYSTSRHGIVGLTKTAALEYARNGIRVNAVAPGSIETDIFYRSTGGNKELERAYAEGHPLGRIGRPEEVAAAALWLCTDAASFVVGSIVYVDGGFTIQ